MAMEKQQSFRLKRKSKESAAKRGDSALHVAARAGNLVNVKEILRDADEANLKELVSSRNQNGETALYIAAENGHNLVISELLKHFDTQSAAMKARNGYDSFHMAAKLGHLEVLKELLQAFPELAMTTDSSNSTALHTAANQGHIHVVNLLLERDFNLAKIAKSNGKTALHSTARMGHLEVVKALLSKEPTIGFRTDNKGQTALHMAVKGHNVEIVLELLKPDPSVIALEDKKGNTALHIAIRKGRTQIVRCLLSIEGIDINAINKAGETPLDIAEKSTKEEITPIMKEAGALTSKEHKNPPCAAKQLKQTVSDIKHEVQSQLQQSRQTRIRMKTIAKDLKKLHKEGLNNAVNSATVVAVLIATVAFAAIFTVPGQYVEVQEPGSTMGQAHIANRAPFIIFFVFDSVALFISLAVVVVQTSIVVVKQNAKKQMMFVINKLMWAACLFISVAFISLTYIVVGPHGRWMAISATVIGSLIMLTTLGSMCYCVILHRIQESNMRTIRRASRSRSGSWSLPMISDSELLSNEYKRMYAL
ncbi:ankyrin repeat-containing protein At5g02620-like [Aristolochia californica]|uniref:ankyrin repeat-containing protein At5g02620-like n=1 Tax=Aristolochia californica TaxID=171875 RepID=UPI0035DDE684